MRVGAAAAGTMTDGTAAIAATDGTCHLSRCGCHHEAHDRRLIDSSQQEQSEHDVAEVVARTTASYRNPDFTATAHPWDSKSSSATSSRPRFVIQHPC